MARTRTTIRRVDPWSILKFGFIANLVLLGIWLLAGAVLWYVIQRLELIQTVCELAGTVGFEECGVDGGALFDTVLVLGLLGVVIQTGILVFMTFLANLIFDLTGGIAVTLEDDRAPAGGRRGSAGVGTRSQGGGASFSGASAGSAAASAATGDGRRSADTTTSSPPLGASSDAGGGPPVPPLGSGDDADTTSATTTRQSPTDDDSERDTSDDDTLFGRS